MAILLGTLDADTIRGTDNADVITALSGDDIVFGGDGADVIDGGLDNDTLYANTKTQWGDGSIDTVLGGDGDDHIYGGYGDILSGGTGFDILSLDLSQADHGISVNFRPMTLLDLTDLVKIKIDGTELSGFQAVSDVNGSAFNDRIVLGNSGPIGVVVDGGAGNDMVKATSADDTLRGGEGDDRLQGRVGHDVLQGGDGDDRLSGGRLSDTLTGGAGADLFVFADGDTASPRARADKITDFSHADGDKISLRGMDAVLGGDNDQFNFIGSDRFSGQAGELRFGVVNGATFVSGDTNGDGHADFTIRLDGALDLVKSDFQL